MWRQKNFIINTHFSYAKIIYSLHWESNVYIAYDINEIKMVTINFHKLYKIITLYWFCNHKIKFEKKPKFTNIFFKNKVRF